MCLQIGGLIGNQRIGSGVRLIEAIGRERFHLVENLTRQFVGNLLLGSPFEEAGTLFLHRLFLLFRPSHAGGYRHLPG